MEDANGFNGVCIYREIPSYYGGKRLNEEIASAIKKLNIPGLKDLSI